MPKASSPPASTPSPSLSSQEPAAVIRSMNFDSMEEKIRGEAVLAQRENETREEELKIKKALDKTEVDRRLEDLRRQLGLKK